MSLTSDHVVEAVVRLHHHAEAPSTRQAPPLTVAISRQAGARGAEVAQAVGSLLGWPVYDHELLARIAAEQGLHARALEPLDEHYVNWLEGVLAGFSSQSNQGSYLKHLMELLAALSKSGHCVIVGRGAAQVLPAATTLRVRLVAPRAERTAAAVRRGDLSTVEAEQWVDSTDAERDRFVKQYFHRDPGDPLNYDLTLNSGRYSTSACAALIVQAAHLLEGQLTSS